MTTAAGRKEHEHARACATIAHRVLGFDSLQIDDLLVELERCGLEVDRAHLRYQLGRPELLDDTGFYCLAVAILELIRESEDPELLNACTVLTDLVEDADRSAAQSAQRADAVVKSTQSPAWRALRRESREAWVARLLPTFNPRIGRVVRRHAAKAHVSVDELKRQSLHVGLALAFDQALQPWTPRSDSRRPPIIPGRDLLRDELRAWLDRTTRGLARLELGPRDSATDMALPTSRTKKSEPLKEERELVDVDGLPDDSIEGEYVPGLSSRRRGITPLLFSKVQPADRDVLDLMGTGGPTAIARQLGRSPNAVKQSISRIRKVEKALTGDARQ